MPLTEYQARVAQLLSKNRTEDSHLAGGAALHIDPNTRRYSNDLDYFHDSAERVATAFREDRQLLIDHGYRVQVEVHQPGFVRAIVGHDLESTKIEWAHDSAWRFMPPVRDERCGYRLHPVDLAVNKVLALVGRNEPRDFLDVAGIHEDLLPLGALCWAAAGKDPGFTPWSLLELLRRRGKYHPEDFARLHLAGPVDLPSLKTRWLEMLDSAESFIRHRPPDEIGCLYYDRVRQQFIEPRGGAGEDCVPHYGRPGGVLPEVCELS